MRIKVREYVIKDPSQPVTVTIPKVWADDNLKPGDKIAMYQENNRFTVEKITNEKP